MTPEELTQCRRWVSYRPATPSLDDTTLCREQAGHEGRCRPDMDHFHEVVVPEQRFWMENRHEAN